MLRTSEPLEGTCSTRILQEPYPRTLFFLPVSDGAGVRDGRLHDARRTAATVLLLLGVDHRTVMEIMGWSSMAVRYQHVIDAIRWKVADQVNGLLWEQPKRLVTPRRRPAEPR